MKVIIDICFILLLPIWINIPFILDISCEGLFLYFSLVRVCIKIFINKLIPYQEGGVLSLLIKLDNTSQKGKSNEKVFS
jgi:hypothetical protein